MTLPNFSGTKIELSLHDNTTATAATDNVAANGTYVVTKHNALVDATKSAFDNLPAPPPPPDITPLTNQVTALTATVNNLQTNINTEVLAQIQAINARLLKLDPPGLPKLFSGVTAYYRSDYTKLDSNGTMTAWTDLIADNDLFPISQHVPTVVQNTADGQPAIRFDRSNQQYLSGVNTLKNSLGVNPFTIIFFANLTDANPGSITFKSNGYAGATPALGWSISAAPNKQYGLHVSSGADVLPADSASTGGFGEWANPGHFHFYEVAIDPTNGVVTYYRDGSQMAQKSQAFTINPGDQNLYLGYDPSLGVYLNADILEFSLINRLISNAERFAYTNYFLNRYPSVTSTGD